MTAPTRHVVYPVRRFAGVRPEAGQAHAHALGLTERELEVLRGMAGGRSNSEIGRALFLSEETVKSHARTLYRKLAASDRAHAVALGFRKGLLR